MSNPKQSSPYPSAPPAFEPEIVLPAYTVEQEYGLATGTQSGSINTAQNNDMNNPHDKEKMMNRVIGGAAVAGGVAGLVVAGPVLGLVGAVGAGALATQQNKAGDVARASGDVVVAAGERAKKIDEKHHIAEKTKKATKSMLKGAKKFDEKHHVGEKMSKGLKGFADKIRPKPKA